MIYGIVLLIFGSINLPFLFVNENSNKFIAIQGYTGIFSAVFGVSGIIYSFISMSSDKLWLTTLLTSLTLLTVGILNGYRFYKYKKQKKIVKEYEYKYQILSDESFEMFIKTMAIISVGIGICQIVIKAIW